MSTRERYHALDIIRGLSILLMIAHHFAVDLVDNGLLPVWLLDNVPFRVVQPIFAGAFVAMSGASSRFGHSSLRRGLKICAGAAAISIVTGILGSGMYIRFGILHFLGVMSILYALLPAPEALLRVPGWCWLLLWLIGYHFFPFRADVSWLFPLGVMSPQFASADYYPLIPWAFMYFFGVWVAGPIMEHRLPAWFYRLRNKPLEWVSKWSFWIYMLHQIPLYLLTLLLTHLHA